MLKSIKVSNHQSIEAADIELGGLTVIVGRSDSGKSSLLRAMRMLLANVNSPNAVTHGKSSMTVRADFDHGIVALTRGKGLSEYRLIPNDADEQAYPKSGTSVPDDVAKFLNLPELDGAQLWWSTQHDAPLLLSETGSKVSAVLGSLTSATTLYEATRSASRRRLKARSDAKVKAEDVASAIAKIKELGNVVGRRDAAAQARADFDRLRAVTLQADRITTLVESAQTAERVHAQMTERLVSSVGDLEALENDWQRVDDTLSEAREIAAQVKVLMDGFATVERNELVIAEAGREISQCERIYEALLLEAGVCPTCSQPYVKHDKGGADEGHVLASLGTALDT